MTKPPRRQLKPATNGKRATPIQEAVDRVERADEPIEFRLPVDRKPIRLKPEQTLKVRGHSNPNEANLLVRDEHGLWHGVLIPSGQVFELRKTSSGPQLWSPPGSSKR